MSADLDRLLTDAVPTPAPADPDAVWTAGRRRRRLRRAGAAGGTVAGLAAIALVTTSLVGGGGGPAGVEVAPVLAPGSVEAPADPVPAEAADEPAVAAPEQGPTPEVPAHDVSDDVSSDDPPPASEDPEPEPVDPPTTSAETTAAAPQPDTGAVADPCGPHRDADDGAPFVDVVAPVAGQVVDGEVALVGCARVFEATVSWRALDAAGGLVADGFTTADAGGPEVGEFRTTLALPERATVLEVFWEDAADGADRDLVRIPLSR